MSECVHRGVSLLVRDSAGCSALHIAAQKGHAELVSFILQQGETAAPLSWWQDPDLYLAVSGFIVCALTFHLKAGSVALTSVFFISCLSLSHFLFCFLFRLEGSSGFGRQRKVRQVFSDRLPARVLFNVLLFVCRGDTALHKAASEKLHAVCRLLVEAGASLKKTNFRVFTVNHLTHKRFPESPAGCLR